MTRDELLARVADLDEGYVAARQAQARLGLLLARGYVAAREELNAALESWGAFEVAYERLRAAAYAQALDGAVALAKRGNGRRTAEGPTPERGFTGGQCRNCYGTRLRRKGTCVTCEDCGEQEGCS